MSGAGEDFTGEARVRMLMLGAAVGVLFVVASIFGVVWQADEHFVTRREYTATLTSINDRLRELSAQADPPKERATGAATHP